MKFLTGQSFIGFARSQSAGPVQRCVNPATATELPADWAKIAKKEFPTMAPEDLKATLDRSFADEIWSKDGLISEKSWETGGAVVLAAGILKQPVPYGDIIDMQFVKGAKTN
jgi:NitT/TauT family transport system substrate-binding protein